MLSRMIIHIAITSMSIKGNICAVASVNVDTIIPKPE